MHLLLKQRVLLPRDLAVLYCMVEMMNPRSGRIEIKKTALAEQVGMRLSDISNTLKRLRDSWIVVQQKDPDTGGMYYLICPEYVSVGSDQKRAYLGAQFAEVMQQEYDANDETDPGFVAVPVDRPDYPSSPTELPEAYRHLVEARLNSPEDDCFSRFEDWEIDQQLAQLLPHKPFIAYGPQKEWTEDELREQLAARQRKGGWS